jgi:hypothetical protein
MESNHIDHFLVRNDPGGQADCYVFNKHKESMKKINAVGRSTFCAYGGEYLGRQIPGLAALVH